MLSGNGQAHPWVVDAGLSLSNAFDLISGCKFGEDNPNILK